MLIALSIRDIVLIDRLELDLGSGLSVLTGETGAGKSILLDALGLALGARADSSLVRKGAERGRVAASFAPPPPGHAIWDMLEDAGIEGARDEALVIRRDLRADGGSRAFIADQPISAALLRDVGNMLVEIHGQHDERGLLSARGHRVLLDAFGRIDTAAVSSAWAAWQGAAARLAEAEGRLAADSDESEWLDHALAEFAAIAPQTGEEAALAASRATMQKGERLAEDMAAILAQLMGSEGALAQLRGATRKLDRLAGEHPLFAEALAAFDRALAECDEGEGALARAADALRHDPAELDRIETRLFDIRALARKHRVEADALGALHAELEQRRAAIDAGTNSLSALEDALARARDAYCAAAAQLSAERHAAAAALDAAVAGELPPLKLDSARFQTMVEPVAEIDWGPMGAERVEFRVATNQGSDFGPLIKIASGGELSRFLLALKVALAGVGDAQTIIFDEIDRGVGGAVASAIGERLALLARERQILVVTHSPQVAARGGQHFLIRKMAMDSETRTAVTLLDAPARQEEIARMLSGAAITDEARAAAARLLEHV